ncbi:hypothetical protein KHM83_07205 [Fusibacter paucivorans]|uniref:Uncharacterized protein n=1 Tax=Fusibacter paucivorans TaxID=76009 RepID=A0ABS5PQ19_9FIRM|nr:hypothetical protein [Fusibacter paucivorans]MBS7526461.1 hypothetical protein [Fusibacter paucivorans]
MKSYLVLENGSMLNLATCSFSHNVLGVVTVDNHTLNLQDPATGKAYRSKLDMKEENRLASMLMTGHPMLGKFVTDELPLDYHLYDLKTVILS